MCCAGVEGTGSYGAGLARYLKAAGIPVMEVERPKRRHLRRNGKSDPIDAEAAARAVLADDTAGEPKSADGQVEMIRISRSARQSAVKARTQAANQLQALLVTAPESLRHRLRELPTKNLVDTCARFRPGAAPSDVQTATKFALRSVARRYQQLSEEIAQLDEHLYRLVADAAPELTALPGIGTDHAATLLTVAGDNPQRLKSEASFASLCGVSPIEASSGKVMRHRLNRGGDRDANRCLHLICVVRMRHDGRTQGVRRETHCGGQVQTRDNALLETLHSPGDLPPTGTDGCGVCAISIGYSSCISKKASGPTLNIGASGKQPRSGADRADRGV